VSPAERQGWLPARLLAEWLRDGLLISLGILLLGLTRLSLILSLWSSAGPNADAWGVTVALLRGFPFDCRTTVLCFLPSLVFSLTAPWWQGERARRGLRIALGALFLISVLILSVVDRFYFLEYANQFDHFVIGLVFDDTAAILRTVWQQYPVVWAALGIAVLLAGAGWLLARLTRWQPLAWCARRRAVTLTGLLLVSLVAIVCGARGSVSRLPAQSKNVAVTRDEKLLNKFVLNPLTALQGAIQDFRENRGDRAAFSAAEVRLAAQRLSGNTATLPDLDSYFARQAQGAAKPPRHVVLLIVESLSAWPQAERYRALGLADRVQDLAVRGVSCPRFLPEGVGTIYSVGPMLTGLPDCGQMQSYQRLSRKPFATSLAPAFRRLGYRTRFFYSGFLSWQRLGAFVDGQGFEEVHGGGTISDWTSGNEWGVDDEGLLRYVAQHQVDAVPTLDVVLTTSNHPPYSVDVYGKGFPLRSLPPALAGVADDVADLRVLGHLWYADKAVGDFIAGVERSQPDTLFIVTGDHYGRRFLNRSPDAWERSAVPCVFYGAGLQGTTLQAQAGSHLDLIPTLIERCAPAGFAYHAIGHDLFGSPQTTAVTQAGGIGPGQAVEWNNTGDAQRLSPTELATWMQRRQDYRAVGWWRVMKGPEL
jgi:phosphoglycerol transferase MdoB-like AlkP superfamily enzyme